MLRKGRVALITAAALTLTAVLGGCGGGQTQQGDSEGKVSIVFWAASNPTQEQFWKTMADKYMEEHPDVTIEVSQIPESPSSEAGITTALSSGQKLTASENIFIGFGAQLVENEQVVPLDTMPGWDELIKARKAEELVEGWKFSDGHQYILPIYSNAMLFAWRMDILKELGYNEPPRTYSEIIEVGKALKAKYPDKYLWERSVLLNTENWWERWYDFFTLYYAASDGKPFLTDNQVTADKDAAVAVLQFLKDLNDNGLLLTQQATDPFETGLTIWGVVGPWQLPYWAEKFPELKIGEDVVFTAPPVPDNYPAGKTIKTFADAKGIVIYKSATEEEQKAAWDFVKWVFSNPENENTWLEMTGLTPARGDLTSNEALKQYFDENPGLKAYADAVPTAVPPIQSKMFTDLQNNMTEVMIVPLLNGQVTPEEAFEAVKTSWENLLK